MQTVEVTGQDEVPGAAFAFRQAEMWSVQSEMQREHT